MSSGRPNVQLFTDGACLGNPGPGGWAFILKHPTSGGCKELSGGEHATTNNRMEITGVIRGLEALKKHSQVELFSDSEYVVKAISDWMSKWKANGWRKTPKATTQIKNADLWSRLDELLKVHTVIAQWVRGHDGHAENERCDVLAREAAAIIAATPPPPQAPAAAARVESLFARPAPTPGEDVQE